MKNTYADELNRQNEYLELAASIAGLSPDRSRKTGAVIVRRDGSIVSTGCNDPPGSCARTDARLERPLKYQWTEHAERNAIYRAAETGAATSGCTMYLTWYPCVDCARAIIQAGIVRIVCVEPDWSDQRWGADFAVVKEMLVEARVAVVFASDRSAPVAK